ncbi:exosporium leader peptide-containing protein [Bacillus thuringiensis]|nr:exosporium leader peptide-containing protein [Bacillus thuringiensis]MEB8879370.1 exosporium leader peptide-containing protein [Bacillus cereus]MEB9714916.1 exosporium leader peptide-containing protein [Bacillus cereus]
MSNINKKQKITSLDPNLIGPTFPLYHHLLLVPDQLALLRELELL